ncbi:MAG: dipicolinate synthase [Clostridia bacterium]|nr:dipicolinate synthase [Clostridia bacterium]
MSLYKKITVLGGDQRQAAVAGYFALKDFSVGAWGLPSALLPPQLTLFEDWKTAVADTDVLVLPLPASPDSKHLNLPLMQREGEKPPRIFDIVREISPGTLVAGGRLSQAIKEILQEAGVQFFDYFESEALQQKNAIPTAEGAIEVLMREVPRTVNGLCVAVTGFGRVSRALVRLLLAMGARVTVAARKREDLALARAQGCDTVQINSKEALFSLGRGFAAIFNTVPCCLFDEAVLSRLSRETLMIDLASAPGGVDANAAGMLGIRVVWALSLPGKYAPITAGEIIAQTILAYLSEGE